MNILLTVLVLIGNIVTLVLVFYSFKKDKERSSREVLIYSMFSIGIIYALINIVYRFSAIGLNLENVSDNARDFYTFAFVPINGIVILPFCIRSYIKMKNKSLEKKKFIDRIEIMGVLLIGMLVCEFFFFRNVQKDLILYANNYVEYNNYIYQEEKENKVEENTKVEDKEENTEKEE